MDNDASTGQTKWYKALLRDRSFISLIIINLITLVVAVGNGWDLLTLMWVYWGQSVVIGLVNFYRMWTLKDFSTEGFTSNGQPVPETVAGKRSTALFFLVHYGFFHFVYMIFLLVAGSGSKSAPFILLCIAGFAANHIYSFFYNRERDEARKPNIGKIMFFPYLRIIPMHLTIIFGFAIMVVFPEMALLLFLILKMSADLTMHAIEHADIKRRDSGEADLSLAEEGVENG